MLRIEMNSYSKCIFNIQVQLFIRSINIVNYPIESRYYSITRGVLIINYLYYCIFRFLF